MAVPLYASGLHEYPRSPVGAWYSLTKSCAHSSLPVALSIANSSRFELAAKIREPVMSGVLCGPAPCEKSTPSVVAGYLNSHTVLPLAASSAMTVSSCARRTYDISPTGRYIVYTRGPSARIDECPSPSARVQSFFGPPGGQDEASPVASEMKLRCGPPHCVQSPPFAALNRNRGPLP